MATPISGPAQPGVQAGRAIFISYRRDDTEGEAGRLYDDLVRAYGDDNVFMDVAGIQPGLDFRKAIDINVGTCGVLLAMLGPRWATVTDTEGARRLDNPSDFVRLEIASALRRNIPVIPVLVHGAKMPSIDQLPEDLKDLRYRNSVELTHARWNSDVGLLVTALKSYVTVAANHENETVHATVAVQLPAPQATVPDSAAPASTEPDPVRTRVVLSPAMKIGGAVFVLLAAIAGYIAFRAMPTPVPATVTAAAPAVAVKPASETAILTAVLGEWKNSKETDKEDVLNRILIQKQGDQLTVHAWGSCPNGDCDWGVRNARVSGDAVVTEQWNPHFSKLEQKQARTSSLVLLPANGGLQVTVNNLWQAPNGPGRQGNNRFLFVRNTP